MYCGKTKRIVTGEPVCFSDGAPFRTQREEVAGRIVDGLNALAAACGELEREAAEKSDNTAQFTADALSAASLADFPATVTKMLANTQSIRRIFV
ncbi:MAG: hypothetical protein V8T36_01795 [Ruthenibacterium lactatiformans]